MRVVEALPIQVTIDFRIVAQPLRQGRPPRSPTRDPSFPNPGTDEADRFDRVRRGLATGRSIESISEVGSLAPIEPGLSDEDVGLSPGFIESIQDRSSDQ